jgi:hypothetical protein
MPALPTEEDAARAFALGFKLTEAPADFIDDPYPYLALLRKHDPVHELAPGLLFVTRYEDAVALYRDPRASADKRKEFRPKLGDSPLYEHHTTSLVFNDPPLHTRVRRLIMGALTHRVIARMEQEVVVLVDGLLDRMAERGRVDLVDEFAAQIPVEVIGNLLDVPREEREPLRGWSLAILSALEPAPSAAVLERGNRATVDFLDYLDRLTTARRERPGNPDIDVLTRLIQGEPDGERLTQKELMHQCIFLLNAGHETTTNLIGNGVNSLFEHPGEMSRLVADPSLIVTAVEEFLRFEAPVQLNSRLAKADMEIGGRLVHAGTVVNLSVAAANRDSAQFPDPDRLDVGRKPNRHVAFGHSDHACAGMNVARLEARIAFTRLLARFPKIARGGVAERDRRIRFRGFKHLPVRVS